jgi:hypothetical protein
VLQRKSGDRTRRGAGSSGCASTFPPARAGGRGSESALPPPDSCSQVKALRTKRPRQFMRRGKDILHAAAAETHGPETPRRRSGHHPLDSERPRLALQKAKHGIVRRYPTLTSRPSGLCFRQRWSPHAGGADEGIEVSSINRHDGVSIVRKFADFCSIVG